MRNVDGQMLNERCGHVVMFKRFRDRISVESLERIEEIHDHNQYHVFGKRFELGPAENESSPRFVHSCLNTSFNKTRIGCINATLRRVRITTVAVEKQKCYILFVCVCVCVCVCVALATQHAMRMRHIVISACPPVLYFCTFSHKQHDFRAKVIVHKMCVLIFSTTFV